MPPKKELCRNFLRGCCQYGDQCKFLHAAQTFSKPNPFGFGMQTGNQFQHSNLQQQKPNPFGFGVQNNSQPRGASEFGSKQNKFKALENKWTCSSQTTTSGSAQSRQPDNQPASHKCTDPESCKRQILEDFENERPLWKLTCYGHSKYGPCDIVGDISCEELRAVAYDDAKRGLSLQSIVERERNLLNSKLEEFDSLLRNPYKGSSNLAIGLQSSFPTSIQNTQVTAQSNNPPSFSSFSQLGTLLGVGATAPPDNLFGQQHAFQSTSQTSSMFKMSNPPFQNSGFGGQFPSQTLQSPFTSSSASFSNSFVNAVQNPFLTSTVSPQTSNSAGDNRHALFSVSHSNLNAVGLSTDNIDLKTTSSMPPCISPLPSVVPDALNIQQDSRPAMSLSDDHAVLSMPDAQHSQATGSTQEVVSSSSAHDVVQPSRSMVSRSQCGIVKPNPKYAIMVTTSIVPREPHNIQLALAHPGWKTAMKEELAALQQNVT